MPRSSRARSGSRWSSVWARRRRRWSGTRRMSRGRSMVRTAGSSSSRRADDVFELERRARIGRGWSRWVVRCRRFQRRLDRGERGLGAGGGGGGSGRCRRDRTRTDRAAVPGPSDPAVDRRAALDLRAASSRSWAIDPSCSGPSMWAATSPRRGRSAGAEANPALGVRGLRLGLRRPHLLDDQFARPPPGRRRSRASGDAADGRDASRRSIRRGNGWRWSGGGWPREGLAVANTVQLGVMIEVPSAAIDGR